MRKSLLIVLLFYVSPTSWINAQDSCVIFVPNFAQSNGDCFDCHKIRIGTDCDFSEFEFLLFDRWGVVVFETKDPTFEYEPLELKDGIYTYRIRGTRRNGDPKNQTGNITIMK